MKVGFAARWSPLDKRAWSGTTHYTWRQIRQRFETSIFHFKWNWITREILTMQKSFNRSWYGKATSVEFLDRYARYFSRALTQALKEQPVDCLFVPASSQLIAHVQTDIPIIYMTDATFGQLQGYYPGFSNLPAYNIREGIALDRQAFHRSAHCMLASDWCAQSAVQDYGVDPARVSVLPCGANLDAIPSRESLRPGQPGLCRLLFLGVDWERKGGDIVLEACRTLREWGVNAQLQIVGCVPPADIAGNPFIHHIPFLDKNDPAQMLELEKIIRDSDLLFLPTRAECAGVVFSECAAFGIPSISTDTGGVSTYVRNGVNGYTLPIQAGAAEYASLIRQLYDNPGQLAGLKLGARRYYEEYLSWDNWGRAFEKIVGEVRSQRKKPAI